MTRYQWLREERSRSDGEPGLGARIIRGRGSYTGLGMMTVLDESANG